MVEETKKHHEQIDPIFKQILEDSFASYKAVCQTEYEVGRLPRKIDALITIENAGELSNYLIVVNDLPVTPNNYPLLVFASSERKFREFLEQVIHKGESTYIRYAYEVRPQLTKEILTMAGISATLSREDLEFMADDIGPELVPFLKAEDLLHSMDPEEQKKLLVSLLSLDDLLAAKTFEKLLGEVDPKNRKRLLELLSRLQTSSSVDQEEA